MRPVNPPELIQKSHDRRNRVCGAGRIRDDPRGTKLLFVAAENHRHLGRGGGA